MAQTKRSVFMCLPLAETSVNTRAVVDTARVTCYLPNSQPGYVGWKEVYVSDTEIVSAGSTSPSTSSSCALVDGSGGTNAWCELGNISMQDAQVISSYVGLVWAIAFGFKALRNAITFKGSEE